METDEEKQKRINAVWSRIMGPTPEFHLTKLNPKQEAEFQKDFQKYGLQETEDYDYKGAWVENLMPQPGQNWPDSGKKLLKNPKHETFFRTQFAKKFGFLMPYYNIDDLDKEQLLNLALDKGGVVLMPGKK